MTIELRRATESSFNPGRGVIIYTDVVIIVEEASQVSGLLLIRSPKNYHVTLVLQTNKTVLHKPVTLTITLNLSVSILGLMA